MHIDSKENIKKILIIDYFARTVKQLTPNSEQAVITVNDLPKGMNIVQITTNKGQIFTKKLIIE